MNAVIKTWRDGPYIFIVQIGVTALKDSANKVKRMEKTTPASNPKEKLFTSKTAKNRYCFFFMYTVLTGFLLPLTSHRCT